MRLFHKCMLQEIIATLQILGGAPSAEATLIRRRAMSMFLKAGPRACKTKAILAALPNGDWTLIDRVQVFVPLAHHIFGCRWRCSLQKH